MAVKPETIDRLLLSRSFIDPLRFKSATDRFSVATHILASHDAAELALAAICNQRALPLDDKRALALLDYLRLLKDKLHPTRDAYANDYMSRLNRVRIDIKHHGITPDWQQWASVAEMTFGHIVTWCSEYLDVGYGSLDATELIASNSIREEMQRAREQLEAGHYKECLEEIARALHGAVIAVFPVSAFIDIGHPDAETALTLSGHGVDPGRFLVLQRLLPKLGGMYGLGPELKWEKRQYGHSANWTQENAAFAYNEAVHLLTRLQSATPYPSPLPYRHAFRDIVLVRRDGARANRMQWAFTEGVWLIMDCLELKAGERIKCSGLRGSIAAAPTDLDDEDAPRLDPDDADYVAALHPEHALVPEHGYSALVFKREDVELISEPINYADDIL